MNFCALYNYLVQTEINISNFGLFYSLKGIDNTQSSCSELESAGISNEAFAKQEPTAQVKFSLETEDNNDDDSVQQTTLHSSIEDGEGTTPKSDSNLDNKDNKEETTTAVSTEGDSSLESSGDSRKF